MFGNGELPGPEVLEVYFEKAGDNVVKGGTGRRLSEDDNFSYEVTEFNENGLGFKMGFKNPMEVSKNNKEPDKLVVALAKNTFFSAETMEPLSGKLDIVVELPK